MKNLFYYLALIGNIVSLCLGFGQKGVYERIMFYSGYLAQEWAGSRYTIAPNCFGTRNGRCNFNEFVTQIWAPSNKDNVPPTKVNILDEAKVDFAKVELAYLDARMKAYKVPGSNKPITGLIDYGKLFPQAANYFVAMEECGSVIGQAKQLWDSMADDNPKKDAGKTLINRGKEAADMIKHERAKKLDNHKKFSRIQSLESRLGGLKLATKPGTIQSEILKRLGGSYQVLDVAQSIKDNPTRETDIRNALKAWEADPANRYSNRKHLQAFLSAQRAANSCGC